MDSHEIQSSPEFHKLKYRQVLDFMLESGKRLAERAGNIADIGITKKDLTEEDIRIERGFKEIIREFGDSHTLFAEEEHDEYLDADDVWIVDPISGTHRFIKGETHYAIVASHLHKGMGQFSAVYDPSVQEMFTAYAGQGAFLNNKPIRVSNSQKKLRLRTSMAWKDPEVTRRAQELLSAYEIEDNSYSMAVNYCAVASGQADGIVAFTKDAFPEFAGGLIVREAGGQFTNIEGELKLKATDRIFIGGNQEMYQRLLPLVRKAVNK